MSEGAVGMLRNVVRIFNAIDARGDDAVAHESQDQCQGHPAMTTYRYHNVPSCLRNAATGSSSVVGWMADGFPIVVERDATGALPTNADLDKCHGRVSPILLNGKIVTQYHYSATWNSRIRSVAPREPQKSSDSEASKCSRQPMIESAGITWGYFCKGLLTIVLVWRFR
jgi:YHYH protein